MTIVAHSQRISGELLHGFQISCHNAQCHGSNFFPSKKHLPPEVVAQKFRQRGWEVNTSGRDRCPNCIEKKRGIPKGTVLGPREKKLSRIVPPIELKPITLHEVLSVLRHCGYINSEIVEIEHSYLRKFRVTFKGADTVNVNQLVHTQAELCAAFGGALVSSYLRNTSTTAQDKNVFSIETVMYWFFALDMSKVQPQPTREAAE